MSNFVRIFLAAFTAAIIIILLQGVARRKKPLIENTHFSWNVKTRTLESDDPDIFVRVIGNAAPESHTDYVLHIGSKHIGFSTALPAKLTDDGRRIWLVNAIGTTITRGGSRGTTYANRTKFVDEKEQEIVVRFISLALTNFVHSRREEKRATSIVKFEKLLQQRLENGELIREAIDNDNTGSITYSTNR